MAYGSAEGLGGFKLGAEGLGKAKEGMSAWDALISQSEFSPFMGDKKKAVAKAVDSWKNPVWDAAGSYTGDIS
jgi:hypothetical protein